MGIRCTDHVTPSPQKLALTYPTSGGRSVGIVRLRTKSHGVFFQHVWDILGLNVRQATNYPNQVILWNSLELCMETAHELTNNSVWNIFEI
jgi:hypothetical protein